MANQGNRSQKAGDDQEQSMKGMPPLNRRTFLKGSAAGFTLVAGGLAAGGVLDIVAGAEEDDLPLSKGVVVANQELCSGCRTCEAVCTTVNSQGRTASGLARIILEKHYLKVEYEVNPCFQCVEPLCLPVCPVDAIIVDKKSGTNARLLQEDKCIGCLLCIEACGGVFTPPRPRFDKETEHAVKCHLCFGDPQCVKFCPCGALSYAFSEDGVKSGNPIITEG
jgi:Fe-S-cluster-containing hydrogenase component 2